MSKMRWLPLALVTLWAGAAVAQGEPVALTVREVVGTAQQHSPQLKASLLELDSAQWDVFGEEGRYEPVLLADASATQTVSPTVLAGVRLNRSRRVDTGLELRKHLLAGTDLSLRLSGSTQWINITSTSIGGGTSPGMGGLGGMAGMGSPVSVSGGTFFGDFGPIYGLSAKLTLKQPLWRGRGTDVGEALLREARAQKTASEHTRDRVSSELLRDVLTAYWELWYAEAAVDIQLHSQAVAKKQRDDAAARAASGSLAEADVLTFDTQVATREEQLVDARAERERRSHELARLLGNNEREPSLGSPADEPVARVALAPELVEQRALQNSALLQERVAALELARVRRKTADDPSKPRLDLDSYVQVQGLGNESVRDAAKQFVTDDVVSAFVGLTYEAPLRDRVRRAEAARARIAVQVAEEQLREARGAIVAEVRSALVREAAARQKVSLAEQTARIAERQLAAEQARYQSGSATPLSVLEAEDKVRSAQLRLSRARADLTESGLVIENLTGELLANYARK